MPSTREIHNPDQGDRTYRVFLRALRTLVDAAEHHGRKIDVMALLNGILQSALEMTGSNDGSLLALDEDTNELVFAAIHGAIEDSLVWHRIPPGKGVVNWVVRNRRSTIVNEPREDERFYDNLDVTFGFRTKAILAAPLIGEGKILGVIEVVNKHDGKLFSTGDQELLTLFSRVAGELLYGALKTCPQC